MYFKKKWREFVSDRDQYGSNCYKIDKLIIVLDCYMITLDFVILQNLSSNMTYYYGGAIVDTCHLYWKKYCHSQ